MAAVTRIFDDLGLQACDARSTIAGIRSVLDTGKADPSKESRDDVLWDEDGLVTITGGKLTMFRHMAQGTLRFVRAHLPNSPLPDRHARALDALNEEEFAALAAQHGLNPALQLRLLGRYGHFAPDLLRGACPGDLQPVGDTPTLWAELRWAAGADHVVHLEDLLLRRTRIGLLLPDGAIGEAKKIRALCQAELGWDDARWQNEVNAYCTLWQRAYSPPSA